MNILITGGAGFIGSHLTKALLLTNYKIVVVDNFNDYYDPKLKHDRIKKFLGPHQNLKVIKADVADYKSMERLFKKHKFDKICHLAAQAGVRYSLSRPFVYEHTNLLGTLNLLELCRHCHVNNFIFASSSSVYGSNKKLPFAEADMTDHPISLYAATKKSCEQLAYTYHRLFGLNCTGLRYFTVYGPWGRPDMALFKFTKNIIAGQPIEVYNQGRMARDFTYIDDIIQGTKAAIEKCYPYEIFNLARGQSIKLTEFIGEIEKNLSHQAIQTMMPIQPGDVPATAADIAKARKMLGYNPQTSVKQGIKQFIDWYQGYYRTKQ